MSNIKELQPYQQRLLDEKQELDERVEKLSAFVNSENLNKASEQEQELLRQQLAIMTSLQVVLQKRIDLW